MKAEYVPDEVGCSHGDGSTGCWTHDDEDARQTRTWRIEDVEEVARNLGTEPRRLERDLMSRGFASAVLEAGTRDARRRRRLRRLLLLLLLIAISYRILTQTGVL